jgi:hypothetical protein
MEREHEIKHDGHRLMARCDPAGIRLSTKTRTTGRTATRPRSQPKTGPPFSIRAAHAQVAKLSPVPVPAGVR